MYVWNGFTVVGKRPDLTERILAILENAEEQLGDDPSKSHVTAFEMVLDGCLRVILTIVDFMCADPSEYHKDDLCVVQLLKGLCLRHLGRLVQAELCFNYVISWWDHLSIKLQQEANPNFTTKHLCWGLKTDGCKLAHYCNPLRSFELFCFLAVKRKSSTTATWCHSPHTSWACCTSRKVTSARPSLWLKMQSKFPKLEGWICKNGQKRHHRFICKSLSQQQKTNQWSSSQGKLQRLQHGVEATLPHPRRTQHNGHVCSQTSPFTHTSLEEHITPRKKVMAGNTDGRRVMLNSGRTWNHPHGHRISAEPQHIVVYINSYFYYYVTQFSF